MDVNKKNKNHKSLNVKYDLILVDCNSLVRSRILTLSGFGYIGILTLLGIGFTSLGALISVVYFHEFVDSTYQAEQNANAIRQLYKDYNTLVEANSQCNNFIDGIQNAISNQNMDIKQLDIYKPRFICPVDSVSLHKGYVASEHKYIEFNIANNTVIKAASGGVIIHLSQEAKNSTIIIQQGNFVFIYEGEFTPQCELYNEVICGFPIAISNGNSVLYFYIFNNGTLVDSTNIINFKGV